MRTEGSHHGKRHPDLSQLHIRDGSSCWEVHGRGGQSQTCMECFSDFNFGNVGSTGLLEDPHRSEELQQQRIRAMVGMHGGQGVCCSGV